MLVAVLLAGYRRSLPCSSPPPRELLHCCLQGSLLVKPELMAFRVPPASLLSIYKETTSTSWGFLCTSLLLFCLTSSARSACELWLMSVGSQMMWLGRMVRMSGQSRWLRHDQQRCNGPIPAADYNCIGYKLYYTCLYHTYLHWLKVYIPHQSIVQPI